GKNLVYTAPTSGGKTLVADILMMRRCLYEGKRALILLPFVAMCNERIKALQQVWGHLVRVQGFFGQAQTGNWYPAVDVAVCTYEKANLPCAKVSHSKICKVMHGQRKESSLCYAGSALFVMRSRHQEARSKSVMRGRALQTSWVMQNMHDKSQNLPDPDIFTFDTDADRGWILELILTKIRLYSRLSVDKLDLQIIGLSATLSDLPVLARWLDAGMYNTRFRPIPLLPFSNTFNYNYAGGPLPQSTFPSLKKSAVPDAVSFPQQSEPPAVESASSGLLRRANGINPPRPLPASTGHVSSCLSGNLTSEEKRHAPPQPPQPAHTLILPPTPSPSAQLQLPTAAGAPFHNMITKQAHSEPPGRVLPQHQANNSRPLGLAPDDHTLGQKDAVITTTYEGMLKNESCLSFCSSKKWCEGQAEKISSAVKSKVLRDLKAEIGSVDALEPEELLAAMIKNLKDYKAQLKIIAKEHEDEKEHQLAQERQETEHFIHDEHRVKQQSSPPPFASPAGVIALAQSATPQPGATGPPKARPRDSIQSFISSCFRCPSGLCPVLRNTVPLGIAYHHSGLLTEERAILEEAFRTRVLLVFCCTTTLAVGVNLPCRRVLLCSLKTGPVTVDLPRFLQIIGRAGRAGYDTEGECVVCVEKKESKVISELLTG
ncbi:unnamed protein product, partial [Amoebophrya sp. A120]